MALLIFLALNLLLMAGLLLAGLYLFLQVEDKAKRSKPRLNQSSVAELQALLQAQGHDEALQHLMQTDDMERFSAEQAIEALRRQNPGKPR